MLRLLQCNAHTMHSLHSCIWINSQAREADLKA